MIDTPDKNYQYHTRVTANKMTLDVTSRQLSERSARATALRCPIGKPEHHCAIANLVGGCCDGARSEIEADLGQ